MRGIVSNFDINTNFWKSNKQLLLSSIFKSLYNSDKSKDKTDSSKLMWGVVMLIDSSENNKFRNLPFTLRKDIISNEWFKDKNFNWDSIENIINELRQFYMSPGEKMLYDALEKMEERAQFIKFTKYDEETAKLLDDMQKNTKVLYDLFKKIQEDLDNESSATVRGGAEESASEKGLI